jgi:hypothetical protein
MVGQKLRISLFVNAFTVKDRQLITKRLMHVEIVLASTGGTCGGPLRPKTNRISGTVERKGLACRY